MSVATLDPLALIASMAQKQSGKKKSTKAGVNNPALDGAIDQWINAKREVDKWTGIQTTAEAQILAFGTPARMEECRRMGRVESSIRINGRLTFTQKAQYCQIAAEHEPALAEAFGDDAANYFRTRTKLELTEAATENPMLLAKLVEPLGPEEFARAFGVKRAIEVTEAFHNYLTLRPEVAEKARCLIESEIIKPYKPSLRQ